MKKKRCQRCKVTRKSTPWTCRSCQAACCEHLCSLKTNDGLATCGTCKGRDAKDIETDELRRDTNEIMTDEQLRKNHNV